MKLETYTLLVASNRRGTIRKITVPFYALHVLAALSAIGAITVTAAFGSYSRMLWKVGNYNALREKQATLQQQFQQLQKAAKDTDQRLSSLQSLATDVAVTYGFVRSPNSPFGVAESPAEPGSVVRTLGCGVQLPRKERYGRGSGGQWPAIDRCTGLGRDGLHADAMAGRRRDYRQVRGAPGPVQR